MDKEIFESDQSSSSSNEDEEDPGDSSSEEEILADSSSDDGSRSDTDSDVGPLEPRKSSANRPKLSDFLESNKRNADQLPADSGNRSLQQEIEAKKIAPQLTRLVGQSMYHLNSAVESLGLEEEDIASLESLTGVTRESWSSDVTDTTALRRKIAAADEGRLSANSATMLLPPDLRAMLAQMGSSAHARRSLAIPPSPMMQGTVDEEDEGGSSSSSSSNNSSTLPPNSERIAEAAIKEEDSVHSDSGNNEAASFGSHSSNSQTVTYKSTTPPLNSKLENGPTMRPKQKLFGMGIGLAATLILLLIFIVVLLASLPSNSGKSLLSASMQAKANAKLIRNKTPESPKARTHVSDDTLYRAFEALVGDGIHVAGSSQYFAALWILAKDPRRHRSTLERLEQRFLLACFYFQTTDNCRSPWLSCNFELASSFVATDVTTRQAIISHADHSTQRKDVSRTAPIISERNSTSRSNPSSCELKQPVYDGHGEVNGYETIETFRWLSGHSECSWAGVSCKHDDDSLAANPVVEINLEGQMEYGRVVTEILALPSLESLYY